MSWTTTTLETRGRLYAFERDAAKGGLTQAQVLALADDEVQSYCFPRLLMAHEEYAVTSEDQALVEGTAAYPIPARAYLGRLRDVLYVDAGGRVESLALADPDELGNKYTGLLPGIPRAFYLQAGSVVLIPTPDGTTGTLRLSYNEAPSTLVPTSECALITDITSDVYTCANVPASWDDTMSYDFVSATGLGLTIHTGRTADDVVTGVDGTLEGLLTNNDISPGVSVGDYICLAGESCVPQLPSPLLPWLARRTACAILELRGSLAELQAAESKAMTFEKRLADILKPRVEGEPRVITSPNSPFRAGRFGYGGLRYGRMP